MEQKPEILAIVRERMLEDFNYEVGRTALKEHAKDGIMAQIAPTDWGKSIEKKSL